MTDDKSDRPVRYAIWAAVSTERQAAEDKISLEDQESRCRKTANRQNWVEASGPYIVPGETRTQFINLRDAEAAIPELRQMLNDAERGKFDVLVLYDYHRLRELMDPVYRTLAAYGVQIHNATQNLPIQPPDEYNKYRDDTAWMMMQLSNITSRKQVHDLRQKYETGMPARVTKGGIPAISIPFAYRKPPGRELDSKAIPIQDPAKALMVVKFKDLLLQGYSTRKIVDFANGTGIKAPRGGDWGVGTIREILRNPFYAGYNRWGISRNFTDPRTGKRIRKRDIDPEDVIVEKGFHQPLWDEETHARIIAELDARGNAYRGKSVSQLSRLLICDHCGTSIWLQHNGPRSEPDRAIWRCSNKACGQANILNSQAIEQAGEILAAEIGKLNDPRQTQKKKQNNFEMEQSALADLLKRRDRLVDIYQDGGLTKEEYLHRRKAIDKQINDIEDQILNAKSRVVRTAERQDALNQFANLVGGIPLWLERDEPAKVNQFLRYLLTGYRVRDDRIVEIIFKEED
jgi:site-specific DNA recombinase